MTLKILREKRKTKAAFEEERKVLWVRPIFFTPIISFTF
jgi:hypothetical protein